MTRRLLAAAAALLGLLALVPRTATNAAASPGRPTVAPVELGEWIRARKPGLRIIDLRTEEQFEEYHLPRAERMTVEALSSARFQPSETLVFLSDAGARAARASGPTYVLRGGLQGWFDEVMNPTITEDAPADARRAYQRASAISRYFGGVPRIVDRAQPRTESNTAAAIRRRGC